MKRRVYQTIIQRLVGGGKKARRRIGVLPIVVFAGLGVFAAIVVLNIEEGFRRQEAARQAMVGPRAPPPLVAHAGKRPPRNNRNK
ncbi:MAG TPA: hypothetical protein VJ476_08845 [Rhizomicrobium sp.]|nr:hypothetical protein [Rhizomicrobium sp.]